ncbi:unnamed protein product, partial [Ectocarpus fasciculatus]
RHLERLSDLGDIPTEVFIDLLRRAKEKATPALVKRLQDVNAALEETPVSVGLLKATLIGKAVSQFRKAANPEVARTAMELVRRWKEAAGVAAAATTAAATTPGGGGSAAGRSSGGGGGGEAVQRSPAEEKRRALEEGFRCRTWESLYQEGLRLLSHPVGATNIHTYLELLREEKVRTSSKRAREARERELQKRPKLIVGKSKG